MNGRIDDASMEVSRRIILPCSDKARLAINDRLSLTESKGIRRSAVSLEGRGTYRTPLLSSELRRFAQLVRGGCGTPGGANAFNDTNHYNRQGEVMP